MSRGQHALATTGAVAPVEGRWRGADLAACSDAYEVDEVKQIHDQARAIEIYARQARNVEEAERRCGQWLREMEKAKAGRPPENRGAYPPSNMGLVMFQ